MEQLHAQQAGAALRALGDARDAAAASTAASRGYDRAPPVTSAAEHEYADAQLRTSIERPYATVRHLSMPDLAHVQSGPMP